MPRSRSPSRSLPSTSSWFAKRWRSSYADWSYAQNSKDAEWWERSGAQVWLRFMEGARRHQLPLSFEAVQFFRAFLSYDAICNRLNKQLNFNKEYRAYLRQNAREARRRVQSKIRSRLANPTNMDYLQAEQLVDTANQFLFQLQRNMEHPVIHFKNAVGKLAYIARLLLRSGYLVAAGLFAALLADSIAKHWLVIRSTGRQSSTARRPSAGCNSSCSLRGWS
jgi:hypothetical protein